MAINNVSGTSAATPARAPRVAAPAAEAAQTYAMDSASFTRRAPQQVEAEKPSLLKAALWWTGMAATFGGMGVLAAATAAPLLELPAFLTPMMLFWASIPTIAAGAVALKVASD